MAEAVIYHDLLEEPNRAIQIAINDPKLVHSQWFGPEDCVDFALYLLKLAVELKETE